MSDPFSKAKVPDIQEALSSTDYPRISLAIRQRCFMCGNFFTFDSAEGVPDGGAICPKCTKIMNRKITERVYLKTGKMVGAITPEDNND